MPEDYCPINLVFGDKRGDIGTVKLTKGIRPSGRLLDVDGQPVAGLLVTADRIVTDPPQAESSFRTTTNYEREAVTDAEGRFTFAPVDPGQVGARLVPFADVLRGLAGLEQREHVRQLGIEARHLLAGVDRRQAEQVAVLGLSVILPVISAAKPA